MLPTPFDNALVLTGPTGSGKTQLGIELAQRLDAEIVSMDSMAVYRGMDIGTAKPTPAERAPRCRTISSTCSSRGSRPASPGGSSRRNGACRDIESRGKRVLFVGGTPLYLKALPAACSTAPPPTKQSADA